jgi:hypothetical protein
MINKEANNKFFEDSNPRLSENSSKIITIRISYEVLKLSIYQRHNPKPFNSSNELSINLKAPNPSPKPPINQ